MITIIAQSHRIARIISYVLHADYEHNGYFANDKYYITWTYGHMVELNRPRGNAGFWFKDSSFPVLPNNYVLTAAPSNHSDGRNQPDPQLNVLRGLLAKSRQVIIATDPTLSGSLMAHYALKYLGFEGKVGRVILNDLMSDTIKSRLYYPYENSGYEETVRRAMLKDRVDWLTNINVSRALAFSSGMNTYPYSRTSAPIVKLLAERELAIKQFQPVSKVLPTITVKDWNGEVFSLRCDTYHDSISTEFVEKVKAGAEATVTVYRQEEYSKISPRLHNILSLQLAAARYWRMDPADTYRIARSLYEKKRISFPGISRDGITRREYDNFRKNILPNMQASGRFDKFFEFGYKPRFSASGKDEGSREHGIILTSYPIVGLTKEETQILFLIGWRMLTTFTNNFCYRITRVMVECGGHSFGNDFVTPLRQGYYPIRRCKEFPSDRIPVFEEGVDVRIESVGSVTKTTSPPKLYSDESILLDMLKLHEEAFCDGLAKDLIYLQSQGYVRRNRLGEYSLTESGKALNYVLRDTEAANPDNIRLWENRIVSVVNGELPEPEFQQEMERHVTDVTKQVLSNPKLFKPQETDVICPKCGKGVIRLFGKIARCTNPECDCHIFRQIEGVTLNAREIRNLIADGTTSAIRGFVGEDGKAYAGRVKLDDNFSPYVVNMQKN